MPGEQEVKKETPEEKVARELEKKAKQEFGLEGKNANEIKDIISKAKENPLQPEKKEEEKNEEEKVKSEFEKLKDKIKFKDENELAKSYVELQQKLSQQGNELGEFRAILEEPDEEEPDKKPKNEEPENEENDFDNEIEKKFNKRLSQIEGYVKHLENEKQVQAQKEFSQKIDQNIKDLKTKRGEEWVGKVAPELSKIIKEKNLKGNPNGLDIAVSLYDIREYREKERLKEEENKNKKEKEETRSEEGVSTAVNIDNFSGLSVTEMRKHLPKAE